MTSMDLTIVICFLFTMILLIFKSKLKSNDDQKLPPGPWKLPLIGSLLHMVGPLPHRTLKSLASKHGPLMHLQLGQISAIVISSPPLAKQAMKTNDLALASRPSILASQITGYNNQTITFAPYGHYWRQMRKMCTLELLSVKKVRSFHSIREEEVHNLVQFIHDHSEAGPINLTHEIFSATNITICRAIFGSKCKEQDSLIKSMHDIISLAGGFDVADLFPSFKLLHLICGTKSQLEKLHQNFDSVLDNIINQRLYDSSTGADRIGDHEDLLDVLLRLRDDGSLDFPITHTHIKAIIMDMFVGGTDTSSTVLEWAMAEMIRNPRVMEKAQSELRQTLKGKKVINESDIIEVGYLKMVIKETLRLHPPVVLLLPRECREECEIGGYTIPVKTKVIINAWAIGRDAEHWKDSKSFYPERFDNNNVTFLGSDYEFIPFGAGRRICPGINLGIANVELTLASLLYHFDWKLPNGRNSEDIDMVESFGVAVRKKNDLCLIATNHIA